MCDAHPTRASTCLVSNSVRTAPNRTKGLGKDSPATWRSTAADLEANLEHVLASEHLRLVPVGQDAGTGPLYAAVRGWVGLAAAARDVFVDEVSDHCPVCVEVVVGEG